jgi:hypothetical protein
LKRESRKIRSGVSIISSSSSFDRSGNWPGLEPGN